MEMESGVGDGYDQGRQRDSMEAYEDDAIRDMDEAQQPHQYGHDDGADEPYEADNVGPAGDEVDAVIDDGTGVHHHPEEYEYPPERQDYQEEEPEHQHQHQHQQQPEDTEYQHEYQPQDHGHQEVPQSHQNGDASPEVLHDEVHQPMPEDDGATGYDPAVAAYEDEKTAPTTTGESTPPTNTVVNSTPAAAPSSTSTPKSLKQKLSQIPARLSRLSLLNALKSGTYVVTEPKNNMADPEAQNRTENDQEEKEEDVANNKPIDNGSVVEDNQEEPLQKMDETDPIVAQLNASNKIKHSVHRSALTKLLCGLYALLLVVFGIVFALANSLTVKERQHLYYLEVFQVYLYLGSLAVLLYFQICILRGVRVRNNYFESNIRVVIRRSQDNIQLTPGPARKQENSEHHIMMTDGDDTLDSRKEPLDQMSTLSTRSQMALPADGQVAHVGEGINFYLRLGALAFSIGSVTLDGFHIASYFETENTTTCESYIFTVVYVFHLMFTFIQTFFLFKNHRLVIDKNKASVRFGLMHLLATNLCVWFITAITETAEDYKQLTYFADRDNNVTVMNSLKSCYEDMTLARTASPYLFPCTIIYSIISAGILYRMYQYVGLKVTQRWPSHTSLTSSVPQGAVGMDCEKANKGLFSGLLIAVITLIAIATFFVFESRLKYPESAIKIFFVTEITLIVITGSCILFGMLRFVQLKFLENYLSLDSVLLMVSLGGAYIYLSFMLISSASMIDTHGIISVLSLTSICVGILESTLQTIFILDGLCRRAENDQQVENKPGRSVVTFLLVCNLALWVVSMFEIKKNMVEPFHLEFYGILPWNIILHMCVPLFIYFRFHSAICLSKIWYHAYVKDRTA